MNLTLSWDLFIIVFFALVITYTFIIGKREAVKIIVACYMAIVAVQGLSNVLTRLIGEQQGAFDVLGFSINFPVLSVVKMVLFISIVVSLAVRSGFDIQYADNMGSLVNIGVTAALGFGSALLIISTVIAYMSQSAILDMHLTTSATLSPIVQQSKLLPILLQNQDLWFALPALLLIGVGLLNNRS